MALASLPGMPLGGSSSSSKTNEYFCDGLPNVNVIPSDPEGGVCALFFFPFLLAAGLSSVSSVDGYQRSLRKLHIGRTYRTYTTDHCTHHGSAHSGY